MTSLLDLPTVVLAGLAAGFVAVLSGMVLALLKVALWLVIVVGVVLFVVLSVVGGFKLAQWAAHRVSKDDP